MSKKKRDTISIPITKIVIGIVVTMLIFLVIIPMFKSSKKQRSVNNMYNDTLILSKASLEYNEKTNYGWPITEEEADVSHILEDSVAYKIDEENISKFLDSTNYNISNYALIISDDFPSAVVHIDGIADKDGVVWHAEGLKKETEILEEDEDEIYEEEELTEEEEEEILTCENKYVGKDYKIKGNTIIEYLGEDTSIKVPCMINGSLIKHIGNNAFANKNLEKVIITDTITVVDNRAFANNNISDLKIGSSIERIGHEAFRDNNLSTLAIPISVIELKDYSFANNVIEKIVIPDSVARVGNHSFENNSLKSLIIGNSVLYIGNDAFNNNKLVNLNIPENVKVIKNNAFSNNQLEKIVFVDELLNIENNVFKFNGLNSESNNIIIDKSLDAEKNERPNSYYKGTWELYGVNWRKKIDE